MDYNFQFSTEAWGKNNNRLTNQIFKLLPMFENGEDWKQQQDTILRDLKGYNDLFIDNPGFMTLVAKIFSLNHTDDKMIFRKIIFEAITELKQIEV